jgi:hypothetical protein
MKSEYILTLLLALVIGYLMYLVMLPFFVPVFWAVAFVIIFYPYYRWLVKKLGGRETPASARLLTLALPHHPASGVMMATEPAPVPVGRDEPDWISAKLTAPGLRLPAIEKYLGTTSMSRPLT